MNIRAAGLIAAGTIVGAGGTAGLILARGDEIPTISISPGKTLGLTLGTLLVGVGAITLGGRGGAALINSTGKARTVGEVAGCVIAGASLFGGVALGEKLLDD